MNRNVLKRELKKIGISLDGWLPVVQCDVCKRRWEPFNAEVGPSARTARFDYWKCPNRCNAKAKPGWEVQTAIPRYLVINDIAGMIFDDEDLPEFERYVHSMDATEIVNRDL
ncbi:MAG: hypothetical protein C5B44_00920 [Acidobacteria bacterium]|nr:MAG: hypothetical protein C5B44_00920 [Acidobacteriota bacterium]